MHNASFLSAEPLKMTVFNGSFSQQLCVCLPQWPSVTLLLFLSMHGLDSSAGPVRQSFLGLIRAFNDSFHLPHSCFFFFKNLSFGGKGCTEKIPTGTMRVICLFISACDNSTLLIILETCYYLIILGILLLVSETNRGCLWNSILAYYPYTVDSMRQGTISYNVMLLTWTAIKCNSRFPKVEILLIFLIFNNDLQTFKEKSSVSYEVVNLLPSGHIISTNF